MKLIWKGAIAFAVAGTALAAVPAQAQYYGGRGEWRDNRGWDRGPNRNWRNDRRDWNRGRGWNGARVRCWNEWRVDRYRGQRVRVRICR